MNWLCRAFGHRFKRDIFRRYYGEGQSTVKIVHTCTRCGHTVTVKEHDT